MSIISRDIVVNVGQRLRGVGELNAFTIVCELQSGWIVEAELDLCGVELLLGFREGCAPSVDVPGCSQERCEILIRCMRAGPSVWRDGGSTLWCPRFGFKCCNLTMNGRSLFSPPVGFGARLLWALSTASGLSKLSSPSTSMSTLVMNSVGHGPSGFSGIPTMRIFCRLV